MGVRFKKDFKRDFERWLLRLQGGVNKKFKEKGIFSWGGAVQLDSNGDLVRLFSFGPANTQINSLLNRPDIIEGLTNAAKETFANPVTSDNIESDEIVHYFVDKVDHYTEELEKPIKPVMSLNNLEMQAYFPEFIKSVYDKERLEIINKWAIVDKKTGEVTPPTPPCPNWNNWILNPKLFGGMGRVYKLGNTLWRMKLQCANILLNYGENPDTFAKTIPSNYVAQNLRLQDLEALAVMAGNPQWIKSNVQMEEDQVTGIQEEMEDRLIPTKNGNLKKRKLTLEMEESCNSNKSLVAIRDPSSVEVSTAMRRHTHISDNCTMDKKSKLDDYPHNSRPSLDKYTTYQRFDHNTNERHSSNYSTNARPCFQIKTEQLDQNLEKQNNRSAGIIDEKKAKSNEIGAKTSKVGNKIFHKDFQNNHLPELLEETNEVPQDEVTSNDHTNKIQDNHLYEEKKDSNS